MGDSERRLDVGRQAAKDVVAATMIPMLYMTDFEHDPGLSKDIPKYKRNSRITARKGQTTTRQDKLTIKGDVDSTEFGYLCISALGLPAYSTHVFTFLAGGVQALPVSGSNSMLLSFQWSEGIGYEWQMLNGRVNTLKIMMDWKGHMTYEAEVLGSPVTSITYAAPTYGAEPDNTPFYPRQVIYGINGGAGYCAFTFTLTINNHYDPLYCGPTALPSAGAEHGLPPNRYRDGEFEGTFSGLVDMGSTSFAAGNPYYDFLHDSTESVLLTGLDPDTTIASGVFPKIEILMPKQFFTASHIQRDQPNVMTPFDGTLFMDDTIGAPVRIKLTNALTAYAAT